MRAVDRYVTYYKEVNNKYIDEIVFDRLKKTMDIYRNVDAMILGSEDINGNYFTEIELPSFIFELVASSLENVRFCEKKFNGLAVFHLYSNLKGKRVDVVMERKNKVYFMDVVSYFDNRYYLDSAILVDCTVMDVIIKQLVSLGYRDGGKQLNEVNDNK